MCLDELAADVARRAGPAVWRAFEYVNDAQGLRVRALERTELLAQDSCLGDARVEQREARAVRVVGQRVVEQPPVERGDAGAATDPCDLLNFVLCLL